MHQRGDGHMLSTIDMVHTIVVSVLITAFVLHLV